MKISFTRTIYQWYTGIHFANDFPTSYSMKITFCSNPNSNKSIATFFPWHVICWLGMNLQQSTSIINLSKLTVARVATININVQFWYLSTCITTEISEFIIEYCGVKICTGPRYKFPLGFMDISDVNRSCIPNKTTLTKYCLTEWISKLPLSEAAPGKFTGLADTVSATVYKTNRIFSVSGMANCANI